MRLAVEYLAFLVTVQWDKWRKGMATKGFAPQIVQWLWNRASNAAWLLHGKAKERILSAWLVRTREKEGRTFDSGRGPATVYTFHKKFSHTKKGLLSRSGSIC